MRLNLTLDHDMFDALERHSKRSGNRLAALGRDILSEGLAERDAADRRKRLAADYAAGRSDAQALLDDLESAQFELMDDEGT